RGGPSGKLRSERRDARVCARGGAAARAGGGSPGACGALARTHSPSASPARRRGRDAAGAAGARGSGLDPRPAERGARRTGGRAVRGRSRGQGGHACPRSAVPLRGRAGADRAAGGGPTSAPGRARLGALRAGRRAARDAVAAPGAPGASQTFQSLELMRATRLPIPGALWGRYPERRELSREAPLPVPRARRYAAFVRRVQRMDLRTIGDKALTARVTELRRRFAQQGLTEPAMALALAIVGELAASELGTRPHAVQLHAARAMLDECLAEMATGEGKTLAAALAAAVAALSRVPVHVITVNDYLARRDGGHLRPRAARPTPATSPTARRKSSYLTICAIRWSAAATPEPCTSSSAGSRPGPR